MGKIEIFVYDDIQSLETSILAKVISCSGGVDFFQRKFSVSEAGSLDVIKELQHVIVDGHIRIRPVMDFDENFWNEKMVMFENHLASMLKDKDDGKD